MGLHLCTFSIFRSTAHTRSVVVEVCGGVWRCVEVGGVRRHAWCVEVCGGGWSEGACMVCGGVWKWGRCVEVGGVREHAWCVEVVHIKWGRGGRSW